MRPGCEDDACPSPVFPLPQAATLAEYIGHLRAIGAHVSPGGEGTFWVAHRGIIRRVPTFHTGAPAASEVDRVLKASGSLIANYITEPVRNQPANAWLYTCSERDYSLRRLAAPMRRNVRRGLRELAVGPLSPSQLLAYGSAAFCETRRRIGLDDGTSRAFRAYFEFAIDGPGRAYIGAWKDSQLAALLGIVHVDDWVEIESFSRSSMLGFRPNDALLYVALSKYLTERRCRVVSFGLSSVQSHSNAAGLHRFKRKVGFLPRPVHRAFVFHPSVQALTNTVTLTAARWTVNGALKLRPRDPRLKKLEGVLACMLGTTSMMDAACRTDETCGPARARVTLVT